MTASDRHGLRRAIEILRDLVALPSVNPRSGPSDGGETRVAQYVADWARANAWSVRIDEVEPGRHNAIVVIPGSLDGAILLQTHTDTVEPIAMTNPFDVDHRSGRLYGRGTCDAKGQLAMFMAAVESLAGRPHVTVVLAACVDEEETFKGVTDLVARGLPEAPPLLGCVVGEPTQLRCVVAQKGVLRGEVRCDGPGGHSSVGRDILNPIQRLAEVVGYLTGPYAASLDARHPLLSQPTIAVTLIEGGEAINLIPRSARLHYDRRLIPGEGARAVWRDLKADLEARWTDVVVVPPSLVDDGLDTATAGGFVEVMTDVLVTLGLPGAPVGVPFGSDASKLAALGVPSVVFGAGSIHQAHGIDEFVPVDELGLGVQAVRRLLTGGASRA